MSNESKAIFQAALALPTGDRVELAELLIHSLDETEEAAIQQALNAEIDRRIQEIESGSVELISHEEVMRRVGEARKK